MSGGEEIRACLQARLAELLELEAVTCRMLHCPAEALAGCITERQKRIERMDAAGRRLAELEAASEHPDALRRILRGEADAAAVPPPWEPVYRLALETRAVLSRLREEDAQASLRLREERDRILGHIRENNRGTAAKAARFFSVGQPGRPSRLGRA